MSATVQRRTCGEARNDATRISYEPFKQGEMDFRPCCLDHLRDSRLSDRCLAPWLGAGVARLADIGVAIHRCEAEVPIRSARPAL